MAASGIDIVHADDQELIRHGVRALVEKEADLHIVGECADGLLVTDLVGKLHPQVLLLEMNLPSLNGLDLCKQILERYPDVRIAILSRYADEQHVVKALRNGARAYLLKDIRAAELLHAIREIAAGRYYLSPPLSEKSIESWLRRAQKGEADVYDTLSPRERQVFQLAAEGNSNPAISRRLGISPRTVETHRANLMKKLGVKGQSDLIRLALRRGVIRDH